MNPTAATLLLAEMAGWLKGHDDPYSTTTADDFLAQFGDRIREIGGDAA